MNQPKRAFKGVWIPVEIWTSKELLPFDRCLLADINSLDDGNGCYATNAYLADCLQSTPQYIANRISNLRKRGFILDVGNYRLNDRRMKAVIPGQTNTWKNRVNSQVNPINSEVITPSPTGEPYIIDIKNTLSPWDNLKKEKIPVFENIDEVLSLIEKINAMRPGVFLKYLKQAQGANFEREAARYASFVRQKKRHYQLNNIEGFCLDFCNWLDSYNPNKDATNSVSHNRSKGLTGENNRPFILGGKHNASA